MCICEREGTNLPTAPSFNWRWSGEIDAFLLSGAEIIMVPIVESESWLAGVTPAQGGRALRSNGPFTE